MGERNRYSLIKGIPRDRCKELIAQVASSLPGPPPRNSKWADWKYFPATEFVEAVVAGDTLILWDSVWTFAAEIAKLENCPHLELRVQEGDHWDFTLYVDGAVVADFSPHVEYFDDDPATPRPWKAGSAEAFAAAWKVPLNRVAPYLVDWEILPAPTQAAPGDRFSTGDWQQVFDFLRVLGIDDPHSHPDRFTFEIPSWKGKYITLPMWRRIVRRISVWIKGTYPDVPGYTWAERKRRRLPRVKSYIKHV